MSVWRGRIGMAVWGAGLGLGCQSPQEIPKSQPARLEQHIGRLVVTIEYNRPVARGRFTPDQQCQHVPPDGIGEGLKDG